MNNNEIFQTEYPPVVLIEAMFQDAKFIQVIDILYVEAKRDKCMIHTVDGKVHEIGDTMKSIAKGLNPTMFVQTHRSFIVNMVYLDSCNYSSVTLKNKKEIPIGETFRESFRSRFCIWGPRKRKK